MAGVQAGLQDGQPCTDITQNEANLQKNNRDREDGVSMLCDDDASYKKQTERPMKEMSTTLSDHTVPTARYQQVIEEKERLTEMYQRQEVSLCCQLDDMTNQLLVAQQAVQKHQDTATAAINNNRELSHQLAALRKTHRNQTNELSRLREEYDTYKQQTEQRIQEMPTMIREHTARNQQVIEEMAQLCGNFSEGMKACDTLEKGEEERLGAATPQRPSDQNSSGHKRPHVSSSRVPASANRMDRMAHPPSPHSGTAYTVSASGSRCSDMYRIRSLGLHAGKDRRTKNTSNHEIRNDKLAKDIKDRGGYLYYCGICQKPIKGIGRRDHAVDHMLGILPKEGKPVLRVPCSKWRIGTFNPQDRQDYLLGKYPRRGVRYVKYKNGTAGDVVEEGYEDWTNEMQRKRVAFIIDRDQDDAEAARVAAVNGL